MTGSTWLYLYENREERWMYVGVADRLDRVWQAHNADAEKLRDAPGSRILQTIEPFSTREDALKAEAIAIHVAMLAGVRVLHDDEILLDEDGHLRVTNRAGALSASVLGPAVLLRDGAVDFRDLCRTAIVTITGDEMDDRRGAYGGTAAAVFSQRAQKWWTIAARKQQRIERLLAILSGSRGVILGDWDVDPSGGYGPDGDVIPLVNPDQDDPRGVKGMRLTGVRGQSGRIYSLDLRS